MPNTPLRALLASRLVVLGAGLAGALMVPRRIGWWPADPTRITERLGWVGNVLAAPAVRWDSIHYLGIAQHGYTSMSATVFFPVYPMLVHLVGDVLGSEAGAGVVVSLVALLVALVLMHRLTTLELGRRAADVTVGLLAFAPLSLFFSAVYTESLFLALSVGSIYAARRGRWRLACALAGVAAATRVTGVVLVIPLAIMRFNERRKVDREALWLLAVPAGLASYLAFLSARGYPLLSPFAGQVGDKHGHRMTGPIDMFVSAVQAAATGLRSLPSQAIYAPSMVGPFSVGVESILLLVVLFIAAAALVAAFRRLSFAYGAYASVVLLVCLWSPVSGQPLKSFDRYTLTIFPLWMAAGAWVAERRLTRPVIVASALLLAFWTFQFAAWTWVA